jgi:signal transduction histidine kinase/HAMP domain-containing protein
LSSSLRLWNQPLRIQLMVVFVLLSIATTTVTALTLTALSSHRMSADLRDKSVQYARQLQRELESVVAFDDRLTARELFDSLMGDRDIDGLAVYASNGEILEGRGSHPARLRSLGADPGNDGGHAIAVADIQSREGRSGRLYVGLTTHSIDELQRRNAWIAAAIALTVVMGALVVASWASRPVVRRLVRIGNAADLMAAGDLNHIPLDDEGRDEIGALAHAFNAMVLELKRLSEEHESQVSTERERLETQVSERTQALQQSGEMFRLMAESTKAVPFTLDLTKGCFPYVGGQAILSSGIPESRWKEPGALDVIFPRSANPEVRLRFDECPAGPFEFEAIVLQNDSVRSELRFNGTCEMSTDAKYLRGLMQDVTELRRLERELIAAQKLESVGRLAAGVAHEINTPVQFVSDNVQFVRTSIAEITTVIEAYRALRSAATSPGDLAAAAQHAADAESAVDLDYLLKDAPLALNSAVEGLGRIATIVRSMKEFAHPDQAEKTPADLNKAIQSTLVVAHNEYKFVAEIDAYFEELPPVHCYLGEINQVVLNLIINASHAISDVVKDTGKLGTLTVRTRRDGDAVEISIGDTGTGIAKSARDRIFDPFFTTKEVGRGTGQGLAIARSVVVNKHGGTLRYETEWGKGTTFFIRLPIGSPGRPEAQDIAA